MGDTVKSIKELTKSLTEGASKLEKQAEAGFKSQWMGTNDRGEAEWGNTPGIVYSTVGLPAMADIAKEGTAPEWAKAADEKAGKIREAVERKMQIQEPHGWAEHTARAAGEMAAQLPVPGAWLNRLRGGEKAASFARKLAMSPVEYLSPMVEVGKLKPTATNYAVGTAFGGALGTGMEALEEYAAKKNALKDMIDKYGPASGTETHYISKAKGGYIQKFATGGLGEKLKGGKSAFFSAIDQAIATLKQGKGTPEQMMSQVKKTPGVKKEELALRDLEGKLAGKTSITKEELGELAKKNAPPTPKIIRRKSKHTIQDVQEHLENKGVSPTQIQNVETKAGVTFTVDKEGNPMFVSSAYPLRRESASDVAAYLNDALADKMITQAEHKDAMWDLNLIARNLDVLPKPKYDRNDLRLQGGTDYQEVLIQAPRKYDAFQTWLDENNLRSTNVDEVKRLWKEKTGELNLPMGENSYTGGHWGQEIPDIMAHYRFQTFIDKDGKKVLYVEEIQSDPHQKARDIRKKEIKQQSIRQQNEIANKLQKESPNGLPEGWSTELVPGTGNNPSTLHLRDENGNDVDFMPLADKYDGYKFTSSSDESGQGLKTLLQRNFDDVRLGFFRQAKPLVNKKEIAASVPENYGYRTEEDVKKADDLRYRIMDLRENGLNDQELAEYFTPGKLVKGYGGTDRVLSFNPGGLTPDSPEWQQIFNRVYQKEINDGVDEESAKYIAKQQADNALSKPWSVTVIEVNPRTGEPLNGAYPRTHTTDPTSEVVKSLRDDLSKLDSKNEIPDMPFKKTYDELVLKQIIDDAVQNGYDRVAISPGITQVQRYSNEVRRVVDAIKWGELKPDGVEIEGIKGNGSAFKIKVKEGVVTSGPDKWRGEELSDVLGKDLTDKILEQPKGGVVDSGDIVVGGRGMTEFYDKRVPDFLRDYLKKEFGADTGRTEFEHGASSQKSIVEIIDDLRSYGPPEEYGDRMMELQHEAHADQAAQIARSYGVDLNDPNVQRMLWDETGIFANLSEFSRAIAYSDLAKQIYKDTPATKPVINAFSFDVTPEMSTKVKEKGQRLFAAAPIAAVPMLQDDEEKRKVSPNYTIAPAAPNPVLSPEDENKFQSDVKSTDWFSKFKEKHGEEPNLNAPDYNYRAAWQSGATPQPIANDDIPHWPSVTPAGESLKARNHPSGWMEDYMQLTGRDPSEGGELTPEQTDAMNKSLMYRYGEGYAKGGVATKIKELRQKIANEEGLYAARRLDRAADEVRNLDTTFNERALRDAFMGENTKGLAVINPADFEKYAASIPKHGYDETHAGPTYKIGDKTVTYDEYIKYLQNIANTTGFKGVPFIGVDTTSNGVLSVPIHEGRHRQRALSDLGDSTSLIQVLSGPVIREPMPRKTKEEGIEAAKAAMSRKSAISEDALRNYKPGQQLTTDELVILPELFAKGGFANKIKALKAKMMFEDTPVDQSRRKLITLPPEQSLPVVEAQKEQSLLNKFVTDPMDRREFLKKAGNAAKNTALRGALSELAPLAEKAIEPVVEKALPQVSDFGIINNKLKDLIKSEVQTIDDPYGHTRWYALIREYLDESKIKKSELKKLDKYANLAGEGDDEAAYRLVDALPKLVDTIDPDHLSNVLHNLPSFEDADMSEFINIVNKDKDIPREVMEDFLDMNDPRYHDFSPEELNEMFKQ